MDSFAIIGLGLFGTQLALDLFNEGNSVLVIDSNEDLINEIADNVTQAVAVDATNRNALAHLGISKYDCAVVAISGDLATSVLVTMNLKALGVPKIICKVQNDTDKEVLETLGASDCIIPEHIAANRMTKKLLNHNILDFMELSEDHSILSITVPSSWVGKSIVEINVRVKYAVNIIGIRNDNKIHVDFSPLVPLNESDELIIIGKNSDLSKLEKIK